ncbi:hypothetical protein ANCCAN_19051 [Ancylostoma caninum]|uniref:SCP domain-containing protein n=1 Tax=Ancylostoma caninum TaxID=29170 RepID=A0A368FVU3_ANCCA|nr:hypothetical protein ANCCAN_19051 [Ancylostoma caninum]
MGTFHLTLLIVVVALLNGANSTVFGCENSIIPDDWREMILNFHNEKREIVSQGKQVDKSNNPLPPAQQMYRLVRFRLMQHFRIFDHFVTFDNPIDSIFMSSCSASFFSQNMR